MDNFQPFYKVALDWLEKKGKSIDDAIEAAASHTSPMLGSDLRAVRGKGRPRNDKTTSEFLAQFMGLDEVERDEFYTAVGMKSVKKETRPNMTLEERVFDPDSMMAASSLDEVWNKAKHSGIRLAVAMRKHGVVADDTGVEKLVTEAIDPIGVYEPGQTRIRHRTVTAIHNWFKGTPPDGILDENNDMRRVYDAIVRYVSPQLDGIKSEALLAQYGRDMEALEKSAGKPKPVFTSRWTGKPLAEPVKRKPVSPVPAPKRISPNDLADRIETYAASMGTKLEPEQQQAILDVVADLRKGNIGGVVKSPTGTGKTVMFSVIAAALKPLAEELEKETGEQNSILILVPSNVLERQTSKTLLNKRTRDTKQPFLHALGDADAFAIQEDDVAIYSDSNTDRQRVESLNKPVVIMTYAAYESRMNRGAINPNQFLYTVIDEVDMAKDADIADDKRTEKMRKLTKTTFSSGWSATTDYVSVKHGPGNVNQTLYDRDDYIHATRIKKASEKKRVTPIKNVVMVTGLQTDSEVEDQHDYHEEQIEGLINIPGRDDAIIEKVMGYTDPQTNIAFKDLDQIWFCRGIEHAKRMTGRLNDMMGTVPPDTSLDVIRDKMDKGETPIFAMHVDGEMPDYEWVDSQGHRQMGRLEIVDRHRKGHIPALCNADLLIRGYDSPRTQLAVMTYPSMSDAKVEQIGGRVGRLDFSNPAKAGFIVNVLDRDTQKGRIFADDEIAESAFIGYEPNTDYQARLIADGKPPREPNFEAFRASSQVADDQRHITIPDSSVFSDPSQVKHFIEQYRQGNWVPAQPYSEPDPVVVEPTHEGANKTQILNYKSKLHGAFTTRQLADGQTIDSGAAFKAWIAETIPDEKTNKALLLEKAETIWSGEYIPDPMPLSLIVNRLFPLTRSSASWDPAHVDRTVLYDAATKAREAIREDQAGVSAA